MLLLYDYEDIVLTTYNHNTNYKNANIMSIHDIICEFKRAEDLELQLSATLKSNF
jgi:hypothetical protein